MLAGLTGWLMCADGAGAATANANLNVSATVADTCGVVDANLAFGTVSPTTGTAAPVAGSISVTCSLGTAFTVGLGTGQNLLTGARRMRKTATTSYLTYELYKDAAATTRFGDTGATDRAAGTGVGLLATPIAVYGTVASGQSTASGGYTDVVQITVYY